MLEPNSFIHLTARNYMIMPQQKTGGHKISWLNGWHSDVSLNNRDMF